MSDLTLVDMYLRYPLSYRDLESMFQERGFEIDHSMLNRWVLAYVPLIEKRLRQFRRLHCGLMTSRCAMNGVIFAGLSISMVRPSISS